jgi:hypothetical protein
VRGNLDTIREAGVLLEQYEKLWRERAERISGILSEVEPHEG